MESFLDTFCCCFQSWDAKEERQTLRNSRSQYGSVTSGQYSGSTSRLRTDSAVGNGRTSQTRQVTMPDGRVLHHILIRPTNVYSVDKRLQDHAALFNKFLDQFADLNRTLEDLLEFGRSRDRLVDSIDGALSRTLVSAGELRNNTVLESMLRQSFQRIHDLTENSSSFSVTYPSRHSVELIYESRDLPYDVIPAISTFNTTAKHIRDILDKAPTLRSALKIVLDCSKDLRRDVLVASLGAEGPNCLENCDRSLSALEESIPNVTEIEKFAGFLLNLLKKFKYKVEGMH